MRHPLLEELKDPHKLKDFKQPQLEELATEIRDVLCNLLSIRTAHFASNLGVVELAIALHSCYDFSHDRIIWDTGHQIYPHKLLTGRYEEFSGIRTYGGLMGFPNPNESDYDLFMTGHAGCSLSTALGLRSGDKILGEDDRHSVAVIGDGAFPSGIVFEALNNAAQYKRNFTVILNDNEMSICPRVGSVANYFDRLRSAPFYTGLKHEVSKILHKVPLFGDPVERFLAQVKESVKAGLHGGMLFEELDFCYYGPIDGHDIRLLRKYLKMAKQAEGPVLLHVITQKGSGFQPAAEDPVYFHTPPVFQTNEGKAVFEKEDAQGGKADDQKTDTDSKELVARQASEEVAERVETNSPKLAFTNHARDAILVQMRKNRKVTALTAAMCQGTKMEPVREEFPDRFFDTGICESHAVAFAAGQAKAGLRPIVSIYSTFLQRSFDQIFQEVALQNLPVTFLLDRAGLSGPDGPTHHGVFDLSYMRIFPNMVVMAPGDAGDLPEMLDFSLSHSSPCSVRYPKGVAHEISGKRSPIELGKAEVLDWGKKEGILVACGAMLVEAIRAAELLAQQGIHVGIINARFIKPLDEEILAKAIEENPFVITIEENALHGGFGGALLEMAAQRHLRTDHIHTLAIPDRFVPHGERADLLANMGLCAANMVELCQRLSAGQPPMPITDEKHPSPL
ncbi:MAG: 1-deoxy-D-xylulose-5-phosphate synthase [Pirellulaceae bacterium]|nr:1-deoxy-D-xylulose-5-phosphate synthase [Pirellulaceae bacterium]